MSDQTAAGTSKKSQVESSRLHWFHERFGKPQVYAVLLLLGFIAQCAWLAAHSPLRTVEMQYLSPSHISLGQLDSAPAEHVSPLVAWIASVPARIAAVRDLDSGFWRFFLRLPFILAGALLGASLWYVSRRLYGNAGGYTALALYAFSPPIILRWSMIGPDPIAAWGTFGCIFTGIAVAHTLYAPREVVLWNWRRILLLGVSIGLATASVFSTVVAIPMALVFMLYLVPHRRGAAVAILAAASAIGLLILLMTYSFSISQVGTAARAAFASSPARGITAGVLNAFVAGFLLRNGPAFTVLCVVAALTYAFWPRARYFGTTAPLLTSLAFVVFAATISHQSVMALLWIALAFAIVFVAGVCADLFELRSRYSGLISGLVLAAIASHALASITSLLRVTG